MKEVKIISEESNVIFSERLQAALNDEYIIKRVETVILCGTKLYRAYLSKPVSDEMTCDKCLCACCQLNHDSTCAFCSDKNCAHEAVTECDLFVKEVKLK